MTSVYTVCTQTGCECFIKDPRDRHTLCTVHRLFDAQNPCEDCPPEDVSSIASNYSKRARETHSSRRQSPKGGKKHGLKQARPEPLATQDASHPRETIVLENTTLRDGSSKAHSTGEVNTSERDKGSSASRVEGDRAQLCESFHEANISLTAQVEAYRADMEAMRARLDQHLTQPTPTYVPSISGYNRRDDEFNDTQQKQLRQHNQYEVKATDSVSQVDGATNRPQANVAAYMSSKEKKPEQDAPRFGYCTV